MALDAQGKRGAWHSFVDEHLAADGPVTLTKTDLAAAVGGLDAFLDANVAAINQAIPQPARGALTAQQKAALMIAVVKARYG